MELGEVIEDGLKRRGLSTRKAAVEAGVSASYLRMVMQGTNRPSDETIRRIARVIGEDEDRLAIQCGLGFPKGSPRRAAAELLQENLELRARLAGVAS